MAPSREGRVYPRRNAAGETIGWVADVQWGRGATAERIRRLRPTEQAARALAVELCAARDAGYAASVYGLTVMDLFERYFAAKQAGDGVAPWASSTLALHDRTARVHILPYLKDRALSDLDARDVNYVVTKSRTNANGDPMVAVASTVRQLMAQALTWAHAHKLLLSIAWLADVPRPSYTPTPRREFTGDEVQRLIDAAMPRPDAALWLLLLERGLRVSEACALLRPNIDRAGRSIKLTHGLERGPGAPTLVRRLKTARSYRDVPVSALHLELLDRQLARLPAMTAVAGPAWRERGLVFPSASGDPLHLNTLHAWWYALLSEAHVAPAPPHTCRHTAISRMLRHIPLTEVAAIVGDHPRTLLTTYAHAQIETARPALEKLDARG